MQSKVPGNLPEMILSLRYGNELIRFRTEVSVPHPRKNIQRQVTLAQDVSMAVQEIPHRHLRDSLVALATLSWIFGLAYDQEHVGTSREFN
jgi:hypothetical protein